MTALRDDIQKKFGERFFQWSRCGLWGSDPKSMRTYYFVRETLMDNQFIPGNESVFQIDYSAVHDLLKHGYKDQAKQYIVTLATLLGLPRFTLPSNADPKIISSAEMPTVSLRIFGQDSINTRTFLS